MMLITVVGYCMIALIVFLLIREKLTLVPVFILIPVAAAFICGFSIEDIISFVSDGVGSVLNTAVLFAFSVVYFSILGEIGIFVVFVRKVMKLLKNSVTALLIATAVIAMVVQLDGSGTMTILITIPAMMPIFDAMKVRRTVLVFLVSASAGIMNMLPWCSSMLRISASTGVNALELWKTVLPLQGIGILCIIALAVWIARCEKKRGAGITEAEFSELKNNLDDSAELKVHKYVAIFDAVFTVLLIVALLIGVINTTLGFMIGCAVILVVNYPSLKMQNEQIKKHGATAFPLVMIIFSLGALIGIMKGSGMVEGIAKSLITLIPKELGGGVPIVFGLIGVPLSVLVGSDCCYSIIAPILGEITVLHGGTLLGACTAVILASSMAANITFVGPAPYLSIGLVGITMKENIKFSLPYLWGLCVVLVIAAVLIGIF